MSDETTGYGHIILYENGRGVILCSGMHAGAGIGRAAHRALVDAHWLGDGKGGDFLNSIRNTGDEQIHAVLEMENEDYPTVVVCFDTQTVHWRDLENNILIGWTFAEYQDLDFWEKDSELYDLHF